MAVRHHEGDLTARLIVHLAHLSDHGVLGVPTVVLDLCAATLEHLKLLSARHSNFLDGVAVLLLSDNLLLRLLYLMLQRRDHFVFSFLTVL